MSTSHHGEGAARGPSEAMLREFQKNAQRFVDQVNKTARREYPAGRMGADDDGELAMAVAADHAHKTIVIRFGKPVEWIGLGPKDVNQLINNLRAKLAELGEPLTLSIG